MEKRLLVAVMLMAAVIMITNVLFPPPDAPEQTAASDSTAAVVEPAPARAPAPAIQPVATLADSAEVTPDTVLVASDHYRYAISTRGGRIVRAEMLDYPSYKEGYESVQMVPPDLDRFLNYAVVSGNDTIELSQLNFQSSADTLHVGEGDALDLTYADPSGFGVALRYTFDPERYLIDISGRVQGAGQDARLLMELGPRLEIHEAPDHQSEREFAVVSHGGGSSHREPFRSIDAPTPLEPSLTWVGIKDKYFLAAIIGGEPDRLVDSRVVNLPSQTNQLDGEEVVLPQVEVYTALPLEADGSFDFGLYLGPQEFERLSTIGYDLEDVTPYGYRWLQPIIRPFAALVLWILATMHGTLGVAFGWVLVLFGVMMRIVLWPLNAKAMRSQMKNMAVQPLLQELREKYKNDPQKQQEAMMALYKEHGFNPFGGCLPMLVPFPVLITLFFVFQNTIAFRGEQFLWLPDLSLRDPYYILPVVLVGSMFTLQWVSAHLSGMEQNPQMKMMMYFMPLMMGAIFFMLPSGLNLYYAVTQLASIPQQVLIARERRRAREELDAKGGPKLPGSKGSNRSKSRR